MFFTLDLPTTSIIPQLLLSLLISSVSYYLIAYLLSASSPTSGLGLVLLGRVHEAKLNWHAHVIRSLLETGFWLGVIGFTYFHDSNAVVDGLNLQRLGKSVVWGTLSGVSVVLLGDRMESYLSQFKSIRVKVLNTKQSHCNSFEDESKHNNIGAFSVVYMFYFIGYHTLSFIFLLPYTLHEKGYNYTLNLFVLPITLAILAGVTFTATATILIRISPTEQVGRLLLTRVTHAGQNWRYQTKRSLFELGTWLLVVYGSFHVQYFGLNPLLTALGAEQFCSNKGEHVYDLQDEVLQTTWALILALQLGTIVGSALVVGNYCLYGDDAIRRNEPEVKAPKKAVAPCATKSPCPVREKARGEGLVLYDGNWYSVGKFVPHHPGGEEVLEQYLGTDISYVFRVMHRDPQKIMKYRKPVRTVTSEELKALSVRRKEICKEMMDEYEIKSELSPEKGLLNKMHQEKFDLESFEKDAISLWEKFVENGYFKPSRLWIIRNTLVLYALLASSIVCMKILPSSCFAVSGILLGLFWHQSGES